MICFCVCTQVKRASLVDSRTAVNDVKFAPRHLGLHLVSAAEFEPWDGESMLVNGCRHTFVLYM